MTFKNDPIVFKYIVDAHTKFVDAWKASTTDQDFITQCMFQAIPTIFAEHSKERGGNVLGLDLVKDNAVMLLFDIAVKGEETEVLARQALRAATEEMQKFAASRDALVDWQYLNYADVYQVSFLNYDLRARPCLANAYIRTHSAATALQMSLRSGTRPRSTTATACSRPKLLVDSRFQR
jgi:hypothetical protein